MTKFNRPDHPDFWLISQALIDTDNASQAGGGTQGFTEITGRYVDPDSAVYAAEQRALRMGGNARLRAAFAAVWLDAFVCGIKFQHMKATGAQTLDDFPPTSQEGTT